MTAALETIAHTLESLEVGPPAVFHNLAMFPLLAREPEASPAYLLLEDALAKGLLAVRETSEAGSVPEILVANSADQPVLVLDGEELVGARQNRIVNLTILVPGRTTLRIPVSCVEAGRWSFRMPVFETSPYMQYASARATKSWHVTRELRTTGRRRSDQMAIWDDIAAKSLRMGVRSPTGAMRDIYEQHRPRLEEYAQALAFTPGQRGALFAVDGKLRGLDLFDHTDTLRRMLPKLIRSYALDALDSFEPKLEAPRRKAAEAFLRLLVRAEVHEQPALGLGTDVRMESRTVVGGALVALTGLVHLCAFRFRKFSRFGAYYRWRGRYR